ncbi:peptide chain release factor N(5)-glutamine methyltransferase [Sphingomicrobium nitratireducens]|uniref:peptide chain release factor N(5)-glutamine methyltransferase n=1 Tax=Sphingomicrobium nitratireducens TaxID=2964666 RepID=UPI00223EFFCF|nr:peptide chain release factor N(5)-glutamine methyltransferase [Sphingomicrobium nitratireducens]
MIARALAEAAAALAGVSDTPRLDAELLMAHALGITRERLLLVPPAAVPGGFAALVERRATGEPLAYITGTRDFWTIDLVVGPGALIPRPDSETLIEAALAAFRESDGPTRILDLGTGPGTLLLAALAEWPAASGLGIDRSPDALAFARRNAERLGMAERAELRIGQWGREVAERFDLVLCNPPYVAEDAQTGPGVAEFEPSGALFAGKDGLDDYRIIVPQLRELLTQNGVAILEIGHDQARSVADLLRKEGLDPVLHKDLAGRPRALSVRRSG